MSQRIFSASDFQEPPARGSRSGGGSVVARVVSSLIGLIITVPALFFVISGGGRSYSQTLVQARTEPDLGAILLALAGLVLFVVVVLSGLLSAAGQLIGGIIVTVTGAAFVIDPGVASWVSQFVPGFGRAAPATLGLWAQSGLLLVVGVVLLASALARVIAARSGAARSRGARALVSFIVAVVATAGGLALVSVGSTALQRAAGSYGGSQSIDVGSLLILLAGSVVLGGVVLTSAWSSVGSMIIGTLILLVGVAGLLPVVLIGISRSLGQVSTDVAIGASTLVAIGFAAVLGVAMIGAAASSARARRAAR
ncbi:hypothetical protein SAMN06295879_3609 [Agreia bicolorata]|uniref:Uncharacterized protein n=1 Tax=Agreia bicolorata TaxID=110935 RepID=A0A1T4YME1_9MICO|nr:hypothetical protein [Agreia bicolorata]SKB02843.1 hypothetical protein SAMN06295879_3609 [Agreia bicolorata]